MAQNLFGKIDSSGQTPVTYNFTPLSSAEAFSTSKAYTVGDYVFYEGVLYRCKTDKAAGAWAPTKFEEANIGEHLTDAEKALLTKAEIDGYYDGMTVGNAEQIVGTVFEEDDTAYNYRTTGGSVEVGDRAYVDAITGVSLPWNQLVAENDGQPNVATKSYDSTTKVTTITPTNYASDYCGLYFSGTAKAGHKTLTIIDILVPKAVTVSISNGTGMKDVSVTSNTWTTVSGIFYNAGATDVSPVVYAKVGSSGWTDETYQTRKPQVFDLTAMFGSTIADYIYALETAHAGDGVAWFKRYFPKPYYAYHPVGMEHVNAVAAKTVGFNQCNDVPAVGWTYNSGVLVGGADSLAATKSKMKCLPNTDYCLSTPNNDNTQNRVVIVQFDVNENFLRNKYIDIGTQKYGVLTTDSDCWYFAPLYYSNSGDYSASDFEDFCVSIHWDNSRDGDYEPYNLHTYPLADITLRGIPKIDESGNLYFDGDKYKPDGTVERRYGIVDLGTLNWTYYETYQSMYAAVAGRKKGFGNIFCQSYPIYSVFTPADKVCCGNESNTTIYIKDTAYTDPATFKTAMSGVYLVYELATPTTEEADPYQYPMVVDNWGTEELVDGLVESGDRDVAIPVGHETKYPPNLKDKLESAANNPDADGVYVLTHDGGSNTYTPLASNATIQNIIARLEALEGGGENE